MAAALFCQSSWSWKGCEIVKDESRFATMVHIIEKYMEDVDNKI